MSISSEKRSEPEIWLRNIQVIIWQKVVENIKQELNTLRRFWALFKEKTMAFDGDINLPIEELVRCYMQILVTGI